MGTSAALNSITTFWASKNGARPWPYNKPNEVVDRRSTEKYVRLTVRFGERFQASMGGPQKLYRTPGLLVADIFVPSGSGAGEALAYGDQIGLDFLDQQFGGLTFMASSVPTQTEEGDKYRVQVVIPFRYSEHL